MLLADALPGYWRIQRREAIIRAHAEAELRCADAEQPPALRGICAEQEPTRKKRRCGELRVCPPPSPSHFLVFVFIFIFRSGASLTFTGAPRQLMPGPRRRIGG